MVGEQPGHRREASRKGQYEPTPRWVRVLLVITGLLIVAVLTLLISGGGHGPGRHMGGPGRAGVDR